MSKGRVAIVTGAGSGIGKESAKLMAANGYAVALLGRTLSKVKTTEEEIVRAGGKASAFECEVSSIESLTENVQKVQKAMGWVSAVVNCAGYGGTGQNVENIPLAEWEKTYATNVRPAYLFAHMLVPDMRKNGFGRIVNIASILGITGADHASEYVSSKHAVIGFTKAIAAECGRFGITCNVVCPGYVATPIHEGYPPPQNMPQRLPTRDAKWGTAEQLGKVVAFLTQEDTLYMNGAVVVADGGLSIDLGIA